MRTFVFALFFVLLLGCKSRTVYVPIENTRTEYKDRLQRDSIYLHDSIYVSKINDTIYFGKYRTLYRDRIVRDSIYKNDTIRQPYPVIETKIENRLNLWQRIIQGIGYLAIGIFVGWGIFKLRKRLI